MSGQGVMWMGVYQEAGRWRGDGGRIYVFPHLCIVTMTGAAHRPPIGPLRAERGYRRLVHGRGNLGLPLANYMR